MTKDLIKTIATLTLGKIARSLLADISDSCSQAKSMLFNSLEFLVIFLPITLVGFYLIASQSRGVAAGWLALTSVVFYGWWNPKFTLLLGASIVFNYSAGRYLASMVALGRKSQAKRLLVLALIVNLGVLAYFKYYRFFLESVRWAINGDWSLPEILLPLGISFFTFTQIAFLVDAYQGKVSEPNFTHYTLFVTYFPHLIAGPVLHHKEMMPQFAKPDIYKFSAGRLADGLLIFLIGLAKKVILADRFGALASPAFAAADLGQDISFFAAWGAILSYTFQLYFDFSGYSDMAVGLGRMMGIELPINFLSPYKATNIIDFWRRWHISLSRFLRDYVYIPLGGNRLGEPRRYFNLFATMLLGGIWHGAGWSFFLWGAWHGFLLVLNHLWHALAKSHPGFAKAAQAPALKPLYWALTFSAVIIGWIFFRAVTFQGGVKILEGMLAGNGVYLPAQLFSLAPFLRVVAEAQGSVPFLADGSVMGFVELCSLIVLGFIIVLACPNVYEMKPRTRYIVVGLTFAFAIQKVLFGADSEFLYFQF